MDIRKTIGKYKSSEIVRSFLMLFSANTTAQLIALLIYPFITRLYSAADFGLLSLFLSIAGVLTILATMRYESSIMLPHDQKDAAALFDLSVVINGVVCLLIFVLVFACGKQIALLFNAPGLARWLWLLPVYVFVSALWQSWNNWLNRSRQYRKIAVYGISQSVIASMLKLLFGAIMLPGGLIYATVSGVVVAMGGNLLHKAENTFALLFHFDRTLMRQMGKEQKNFPCFTLPHALVNCLGGNLPILLLAPFFSSSEIGYFGVAIALAFTPISVITTAMYQVLFQQSNDKKMRKESLIPLVKEFLIKMTAVFLPLFILLYFVVPSIVQLLLGTKWHESGSIVIILLPWILLTLLTSPLSFMSVLFSKQKAAMWIEITYTAVRAGALFLGVCLNSFQGALVLFSGVSTVFIFGQLCWFLYLIYSNEKTT